MVCTGDGAFLSQKGRDASRDPTVSLSSPRRHRLEVGLSARREVNGPVAIGGFFTSHCP